MKKILLGAFLCSAFLGSAQTYSFTTAGASGRFGPTQTDVNTAYLTTSLNGLVTINVQGIQEWTVPTTGNYSIRAVGASGGNSAWATTVLGGLGSDMTGDFYLTAGDVIQILVGQAGETDAVGGGGGASYVAILNVPQIVAGGGGGASSDQAGISAVIPEGGTMGSMNIIAGGTAGNGGDACLTSVNNGGGGGGFITDGATPNTGGTNNNGFGGLSFLNGGVGGLEGRLDGSCDADAFGGFGGGGSASCYTVGGGGGGGYSGGAGGQHYGNCGGGSIRAGGGGGGSYNVGTNAVELAGTNSGAGMVIITNLCAATSITLDNASLPNLTAECSLAMPTAPTATNDCGVVINGTSSVVFPLTTQGTTVVTWLFDDGSGNTTSQTQNVIIADVTAPVADNASLADVVGACSVDSSAVLIPTATDNCEGIIYGTPDQSFPITSSTTITWSFTDASGNSSTQTQSIIISDAVDPVADLAQLIDVIACGSASPIAPTATDNCVGTIMGTPDVSLPITTNGLTVVTWTYDDGNGNSITQTQNVTVTVIDISVTETGFVLTANASGAIYQWLDCDNCMAIISGETGQSFSVSYTGSYAVEVTENGCVDTSECTLIDFSGLTVLDQINVSIYPIPTDGIITIEFGAINAENAQLKVIDMLGRVIKQVSISTSTENNVEKIDLSKHENGVYLVLLEGENGLLFSERIVKK